MRRAIPTIALDADGVLLDFHAAYRQAWAKAFGDLPALRDPHAYWPMDRWEVRQLDLAERAHMRACMGQEFWATLPAIPGALEACMLLSQAGYELLCISAVSAQYQSARLNNLRDLGFPIERVVATSHTGNGDISPKAETLADLRPVAFVDDYLPYFRGIPREIHAALVLREPNGSPNTGDDVANLTHSQHADLQRFARWWLSTQRRDRPARFDDGHRRDRGRAEID